MQDKAPYRGTCHTYFLIFLLWYKYSNDSVCLFSAVRVYIFWQGSSVKKKKDLQTWAKQTCAHKGIKAAAPGKTHPPGKPSRPSKRICICGKWQRLLDTHTLMHPHTQTLTNTYTQRHQDECVLMQTDRNIKSKGVHYLCTGACAFMIVQGLNHFHPCTALTALANTVLFLTSMICLMGILPNSWVFVSE